MFQRVYHNVNDNWSEDDENVLAPKLFKRTVAVRAFKFMANYACYYKWLSVILVRSLEHEELGFKVSNSQFYRSLLS